MTSEMAQQTGTTTTSRHDVKTPSSRLLSRLRCGLQTKLLCTAGGLASCNKPSTQSATDLTARRRVDSPKLVEATSDRKRVRKSSSHDVMGSTDSGVGRSPTETLDCASHITTSGYSISGPTRDGISRGRGRRLTTVDELEAVGAWSAADNVTAGRDVTDSSRRRRKVPVAGQLRNQLYSNCSSQFYGQSFLCRQLSLYIVFVILLSANNYCK